MIENWCVASFSSNNRHFYARKQLCFQRVLAIAIPSVRPSVCPSVCHTGGSGKNGASLYYQIFTVGCLEFQEL